MQLSLLRCKRTARQSAKRQLALQATLGDGGWFHPGLPTDCARHTPTGTRGPVCPGTRAPGPTPHALAELGRGPRKPETTPGTAGRGAGPGGKSRGAGQPGRGPCLGGTNGRGRSHWTSIPEHSPTAPLGPLPRTRKLPGTHHTPVKPAGRCCCTEAAGCRPTAGVWVIGRRSSCSRTPGVRHLILTTHWRDYHLLTVMMVYNSERAN